MGIFDNLFKFHKRDSTKDNSKEEVISESFPAIYSDDDFVVDVPQSIPLHNVNLNNEATQMRQREIELIKKYCGDKEFVRNHESEIIIL